MPIVIVSIMVVLLAAMVMRKIRHGGSCCGEHESAAAKIRKVDTDISHYPYRYEVQIEGMVCANCVRNLENVFNSDEDIYACVDLWKKTAALYSKRRLDRQETVALLDGVSYTLTDFKEVKE